MLRIKHAGMALGLGGLLLAQTGCVTSTGLMATATLPAAPASHDELPKDKAIQTCLTYARSLDKNGNDEAAIDQYERLLRLCPDHPEAVRRLAVLYDRQADFSKSEVAYRKLAKLHPRDADLMCDWGYSYYLRNNWREAEARLRRALELDKKHTRARCNLGLVLGQEDRFDEAFQLFLQAGLDQSDAHCDMAFVYWTRGVKYYDRAKRECLLARQLNPACSKAMELLAQLDEAQRPRTERAAAKPTTPERPAKPQVTSDKGGEKYPLPAGWSRVGAKPAVQEFAPTGTPAAAPPVAEPQPVAPASSGVVQGTVTWD
jgi:Tfp pilus assembly protein PilF